MIDQRLNLAESHVLLGVDETRRDPLLCLMAQHLSRKLGLADSKPLERELLAREALGSTAIGAGVALPHLRTALISQPCAVLAVLAAPVDFAALDNTPVRIVILLAMPNDMDSSTCAHIMARSARMLVRVHVRIAVLSAKTPQAALAALAIS